MVTAPSIRRRAFDRREVFDADHVRGTMTAGAAPGEAATHVVAGETASPVVTVAGMHRSGTSLTARLVAALGVSMGSRFLAGDANNPHGYFEDLEFHDLERQMLNHACKRGDGGWPDWGWTESERLDTAVLSRYADRAAELVARRHAGATGPWGWKNPRTTLLLDFWLDLVPDIRYVLAFRAPWDTVDSILRLGSRVFDSRPDYAIRAWAFYNRRLLDFHERHPERCMLVAAAEVARAPAAAAAAICARWDDTSVQAPGVAGIDAIVDESLLTELDESNSFVTFMRRRWPDAVDLFDRLRDAAGSPSDRIGDRARSVAPEPPSPRAAPALCVVIACFNDGRFLGEAVASARSTCDPELCEVIVVDDGSDDAFTLAELERLSREGVRVIVTPHRGLSAARNAAIAASAARYILPLDADNHLREGYAATGIELLDAEPGLGVICADAELFGRRRGLRRPGPLDLRKMLRNNRIDACAVFRRRLWEECGGFDEDLTAGYEDWDLWLSAIECGWDFRYVPQVLYAYRVRPDSLSDRLARLPASHSPTPKIAARHRRLHAHPGLYGASPASLFDRFASSRPHLYQALLRTVRAPGCAAVGASRALRRRAR
jgi:GT2 family glycosyltransferase